MLKIPLTYNFPYSIHQSGCADQMYDDQRRNRPVHLPLFLFPPKTKSVHVETTVVKTVKASSVCLKSLFMFHSFPYIPVKMFTDEDIQQQQYFISSRSMTACMHHEFYKHSLTLY